MCFRKMDETIPKDLESLLTKSDCFLPAMRLAFQHEVPSSVKGTTTTQESSHVGHLTCEKLPPSEQSPSLTSTLPAGLLVALLEFGRSGLVVTLALVLTFSSIVL